MNFNVFNSSGIYNYKQPLSPLHMATFIQIITSLQLDWSPDLYMNNYIKDWWPKKKKTTLKISSFYQ